MLRYDAPAGLEGQPHRPRAVMGRLPLVAACLMILAATVGHRAAASTVEHQVTLQPGWNLYSFWMEPHSVVPEELFAPLLTGAVTKKHLKLAMRWDNFTVGPEAPDNPTSGTWQLKVFDPPQSLAGFPDDEMAYLVDDPTFGNLQRYQAYWLYVELPASLESVDFTTTGTLTPADLTFKRGWNLMGLPIGRSLAVAGNRDQVDFESVLRGSGDRLEEVYFLNPNGGTGFYPASAVNSSIPSVGTFFSGSFVTGSGNWFYAKEEFTLSPRLRTVLPPDSDFAPENLNMPPVDDDIDRNRYYNVTGIIENGEDMRDTVFRFQPLDASVEEIIPLTLSNRGTSDEAEDSDPENDGQGVLAYHITWHPLRPDYDEPFDPDVAPAEQYFLGDDFDEFPENSPFRTWLKALLPTETRILRPDGRVDPVIVSRAQPLSENPITGFVSTDVQGITLVADRTGLPINTDIADIDLQGAPRPIPGKNIHGELWIESNAGTVRRIRVRCEVPPLAGTFEGKAYITRINGVQADPAFSMDLSISMFEDAQRRLRGVIDSERVLLYPKDVPLTGTKLTADGGRYVFTGSFFLNPGDINRYPYDRYSPGLADDGIGDVDWDLDGKYERLNPFPYDIERSMIMYVFRESDQLLRGEFSETIGGLTSEPLNLEGTFEVLRVSYEARKRSELTWTNPRIIDMDPTGTSPYEEVRSTIRVERPLRIDEIAVELGIDHPRVGDLEVSLQAPDLSEYRVFPPVAPDATPAAEDLLNFDEEEANLYETFSSNVTSTPGSVTYRRMRERRADGLAGLKGVVAGSASLYGEAFIDNEETPNVPAVLDSSQTACFSLFSELGGEVCDPDSPEAAAPSPVPIPANSKTVRVSTRYFRAGSPDTLVNDLICTGDVITPFLSSGDDPLEAGAVIAVLVRADPNPHDTDDEWLRDIDTYHVGLAYPPQILEYFEAKPLPTCADSGEFPNFPTAPQVEVRPGRVLFSARDTSGVQFKGGALFVAYFRVKPIDETKSSVWSLPPLQVPANGTALTTLTLTGEGTFTQLLLENLNITHPAVGDLTVRLVNPAGQKIVLMDREGGDASNISNLTFDDGSAVSILGAAAPFSGRFRPEQPLGCLVGLGDSSACSFTALPFTSGVWGLEVTNHGSRTGRVTGWTLTATRRQAPNFGISLVAPPTLWTLVVRDRTEGPIEPVPNPRLVRWALRIKTSGGQITGRVVNSVGDELTSATVALIGREVIPTTYTETDGTFSFDSEFGIYSVRASHPDYEPSSEKIRFFESNNDILDVGDIVLQPRTGEDLETTYTMRVHPYEAWVLQSDRPETGGIDERLAQIRLEFTKRPEINLTGHQLTFQVFSTDDPTTVPLGASFAGGTQDIYARTEAFAAGEYLISIRTNQATFPGYHSNTIVAPQWLVVHSDAGAGPRNLWVNRYSFYTGTSDQITFGAGPVSDPDDPGKWNYFLRDMAGFDIDRPSTGTSSLSPYPADCGSPPDPQDSDRFWYDNPEQIFPQVFDEATFAAGDGKLDEYPRRVDPTGGDCDDRREGQVRWRAFLSFNAQVIGTSYGVLPGSEPGAETGAAFFAGTHPNYVRPRADKRLPAADAAIWYAAGGGVEVSGADVSAIADHSGNGHDATAVSNLQRIGSVLNGWPVFRFAGSNFRAPGVSARTVFMVASISASAPSLNALFSNGSDAHNIRRETLLSAYRGNAGTNAGDFTRSGGVLRVNGAVTDAYVPDAHHILTAESSTTNFVSPIVVGRASDALAARDHLGDIAEVIVYDRVLTPGEMNQTGGYLAAKYGLSWQEVAP